MYYDDYNSSEQDSDSTDTGPRLSGIRLTGGKQKKGKFRSFLEGMGGGRGLVGGLSSLAGTGGVGGGIGRFAKFLL